MSLIECSIGTHLCLLIGDEINLAGMLFRPISRVGKLIVQPSRDTFSRLGLTIVFSLGPILSSMLRWQLVVSARLSSTIGAE